MIGSLLAIQKTRLTINGFEKLLRVSAFQMMKKRFYLINPIYEMKFDMRAVKQFPVIRSIPWLRDLMTTTCYYRTQPTDKSHLPEF